MDHIVHTNIVINCPGSALEALRNALYKFSTYSLTYFTAAAAERGTDSCIFQGIEINCLNPARSGQPSRMRSKTIFEIFSFCWRCQLYGFSLFSWLHAMLV